MTKKNPSLLFVKAKIHSYIAQRSTALVLMAEQGEVTEKEYLQLQLPASIGSMVEDWFSRAIAEYDEIMGQTDEKV
jgi:hypothetical protein